MSAAQCFVYIDRKPDGTPFYVGKGAAVRVRVLGRNTFHKNITKKYPNWTRTVVETAEEQLCREFEVLLIEEIGRRDLKTGPLVNLTDGGEGMANPSPETRAKLSAAGTGRRHTADACLRISKANKGKTIPAKTRAKMSESRKIAMASPEARSRSAESHRGYRASAETKLKQSIAAKLYMASPEARKRVSDALRGKIVSDSTRTKLSAAAKAQHARNREAARADTHREALDACYKVIDATK